MGKRLMIYWFFSSKENQRIKEITRLECNHLMVDENHMLLKTTFGSCCVVVKICYSIILVITCWWTSDSYTVKRGLGNTDYKHRLKAIT